MEFNSLEDLVRIVDNALAVQFYGETSVLRKGVLKVLSKVVAGVLYLFSLIAKRIWKNRFVTTCDAEALDGFGEEYGMPHKPALKSVGIVEFDVGAGVYEVPAGTLLVEPFSGLEFEVSETTEIEDVNPTASVVAVNPGSEYNLVPGTKLEFKETPLFEVDEIRVKSLSGGIVCLVEIDGVLQQWGETVSEYRRRLLQRIQNPPQGGSYSDYRRWAEGYNGVTTAFVYPNSPNTNSVSVAVANFDDGVEVSATVINGMRNDIDEKDIWPVIADVRVFSVTPVPARIKAVVSPFSEATKNTVLSAIQDYFKRLKPGSSISFDDFEIEIRVNSTASNFSVVKMETKLNGTWSEVTAIQEVVDTSNSVVQVIEVGSDNVEFVNGET